ncbi:hypothetical protein AVEN_20095-1 [Araneus ventricosus]|uniref:Uncharacterized protein n=1 Tax=Araneus ventricosus TaxID=182803 RepID=A0A4Y2MHZ0_ARAVE|nr:hypothetical protein AVEN_20095-1 [Araneus ventricosus]
MKIKFQGVPGMIEEVKHEDQRKIEGIEDKFQSKIEEGEAKVQGEIGDIEKRLNQLENKSYNLRTITELINSKRTAKHSKIDIRIIIEQSCSWEEKWFSTKSEHDFLEVQ